MKRYLLGWFGLILVSFAVFFACSVNSLKNKDSDSTNVVYYDITNIHIETLTITNVDYFMTNSFIVYISNGFYSNNVSNMVDFIVDSIVINRSVSNVYWFAVMTNIYFVAVYGVVTNQYAVTNYVAGSLVFTNVLTNIVNQTNFTITSNGLYTNSVSNMVHILTNGSELTNWFSNSFLYAVFTNGSFSFYSYLFDRTNSVSGTWNITNTTTNSNAILNGFEVTISNSGYYSNLVTNFICYITGGLPFQTNISNSYYYAVSSNIVTLTTNYTDVFSEGIFVSLSNGNDANAGTNRAAPVKTIQKGISNAVSYSQSNIYVDIGLYKPGSGLNASGNGFNLSEPGLKLYGGYNSLFRTNRIGYTVLDGNSGTRVFSFQNTSNNVMEGFIVRNGYSSKGGGGQLSNVNCMRMNDMCFSNNKTETSSFDNHGGGLYVQGNYNTNVNCYYYGNVSGNYGGGACVIGTNNYFSCTMTSNGYANTDWGGGICVSGNNNTVTGIYSNNYSGYYGGGIAVCYGQGNTVKDALVFRNSAYYHSAGILIYVSSNNLVSNVINAYNTTIDTTSFGMAMYIQMGSNNIVRDSLFYGNYHASTNGGCIAVNGTIQTKIFNNVITNNNMAILLNAASYVITNVMISNNIISGNGSGSMGISEANGNTTGQYIVDNVFLTNRLGYLYKDYLDAHIVTNDNTWTNINNTNWSGAARAQGNTAGY